MIINFKRIKFSNFFSFKYADIDLTNRGYTIVKGVNNNPIDNSQSNGSGKSSIWEAISYALTGTTIRGVKDVVNNKGDDGAIVELEFDIDNDHYRVCRYKDTKEFKTDLKIYINDEDKSGKGIRDSEKLLAQYIPDLNAQLIGSVIVLGQGLPQRFTNNTPSGRKEILEKLSKSDFMIEDLKNRINDRKQVLAKKLRDVEDTILTKKTRQESIKDQVEATKNRLNSMGDTVELDNKISDLKTSLEVTSVNLGNDKVKLDNLFTDLNNERSQYSTISDRKSAEVNDVESKYKQEIEDQNELISTHKLKISSIKNEINRIESIKDVCPTCGQKIPNVHKPDATNLKEDLTKEQEALEVLTEKLDNVKTKKTLEIDAVSKKYDSLKEESYNRGNELRKSYDDLKRIIDDKQRLFDNDKNQLAKLESTRLSYDTLKNDLIKTIDNLEQSARAIDEELLYNYNIKSDIEARQAVVNKMFTLATRDFRGLLLSNVINFIDQKAKEYSLEVFGTDKLDFKLDGNNIDIMYDGKQIESLSGGEAKKVDIIIQFAIRDMLCKFLGFSCNILVADELFDACDRLGCQKIIDLISNKLCDIESVFIVTHHSDLNLPEDSIITVEKDENGISRIV